MFHLVCNCMFNFIFLKIWKVLLVSFYLRWMGLTAFWFWRIIYIFFINPGKISTVISLNYLSLILFFCSFETPIRYVLDLSESFMSFTFSFILSLYFILSLHFFLSFSLYPFLYDFPVIFFNLFSSSLRFSLVTVLFFNSSIVCIFVSVGFYPLIF